MLLFEYFKVLHWFWLFLFCKFFTCFTSLKRFFFTLSFLMLLWCVGFRCGFFFLFYFFLFGFLHFFICLWLFIGSQEFSFTYSSAFHQLLRMLLMLISNHWTLMLIFRIANFNKIIYLFPSGISLMNNTLWLFLDIEINIDVYVIIWSWYWWMSCTYTGIFIWLFIRGTTNTS